MVLQKPVNMKVRKKKCREPPIVLGRPEHIVLPFLFPGFLDVCVLPTNMSLNMDAAVDSASNPSGLAAWWATRRGCWTSRGIEFLDL